MPLGMLQVPEETRRYILQEQSHHMAYTLVQRQAEALSDDQD